MSILTVDEMNRRKRELGYSYEDISTLSGVPLSTVQKVLGKFTDSPRRSTLEALSAVFDVSFVREDSDVYRPERYSADGTSAYDLSSNFDHTLDDYLALPDDVRVEMIDGVFYDMSSPSFMHQRISGLINTILENYVDSNGGPCIPMIAPADVQLDCDDKTIVEPDVFVVCDRDKITYPRVVGAPDLVVEILSPSSWFHDMVRKLKKYKKAGVREYWIVIPDKQKVLVYFFEKSPDPEEYSFEDEVPVNIWNGLCRVDFNRIREKISFMLKD